MFKLIVLLHLVCAGLAGAQPAPDLKFREGAIDLSAKPGLGGGRLPTLDFKRTVRGRVASYKFCPTLACPSVDATVDGPTDKALQMALAEIDRLRGELKAQRQDLETWLGRLANALYNAALKASAGTYKDPPAADAVEDAIQYRTSYLCTFVGLKAGCVP